jgi:hypothetical protein
MAAFLYFIPRTSRTEIPQKGGSSPRFGSSFRFPQLALPLNTPEVFRSLGLEVTFAEISFPCWHALVPRPT